MSDSNASKPLNVLLFGGGGREHALAWKIQQSPLCAKLTVAPGNPGVDGLGVSCAADPGDNTGRVALAKSLEADLVVAGPEAPLVDGLGDACNAADIPFFGPTAAAAEIEGSKAFAKDVMNKAGVPTAAHGTFSDLVEATAFIHAQAALGRQVVVKADGLCAGKGVVVADTAEEAVTAAKEMLGDGRFGAAGQRIIVEERLSGREASVFGICDGERFVLLMPSEDHKAVFDGDKGPNTGGMGAYCPSPLIDDAQLEAIGQDLFAPTLAEMKRRGTPFVGLLYGGLMLTPDRGPMVIEWNCRFGDPETQVVLPHLESDLLPLLYQAALGKLLPTALAWKNGTSVCVVLAAENYPAAPRKGDCIEGLNGVGQLDGLDVQVFHAGTKADGDATLTAGGRVLAVSATGADLDAAREKAYAGVGKISWPGKHYRTDIGLRGR